MTRLKKAAAFCLAAAIFAATAGCKGKSETAVTDLKAEVSQDDADWQTADSETVLENGRIKFSLDPATAHFTVTDKKTGRIMLSAAPEGTEFNSEDVSAKMKSEISVTYYSEQSDAYRMNSYTDSVEKENFRVLTDGKAIRVYYTMGDKDILVPELLDEKSFEDILKRLGDSALERRFKLYYLRYSQDDAKEDRPENFSDMADKYPIIKKQTVYIADENLTDIDKADISDYLSGIGYTSGEYQKMLDALGVKLQTGSSAPGYTIPIEYNLEENGFCVRVLSDRIEERNGDYKLQKIDVLPYFDSSADAVGSFFAPDGSGALFDYSSGADEISFPCYGTDYSLRTDKLDSISKNAVLPVFGTSVKNGGYLAVIKGASAAAAAVIAPKSDSTPLNHAYASFTMRCMDVNDYSDMDIPIYNIFQKDIISEFPTVSFSMLEPGKNSYSDMAEIYRKYLYENGTLKKSNTEKTPVYMDYICMITKRTSMLGIPYDKKIVLSTIEEITASVKAVTEKGLTPVVRLIGYGSSGFEHKAYTKFQLDRRVGTAEQLKALQKLIEESGGRLYLDSDMQFAYKNGNGFSASENSARFLNRLQNRRGAYDIVTEEYGTGVLERYFISPLYYEKFAGSMVKSVSKVWSGESLPGLSYGTSGLYLGGDYTKNRTADRTQSLLIAERVFESTKQSGVSMMFDNGNAYTLPYAADIVNMPMTSSKTDAQSETVPFLQMVLHSSISYAGTPFNISENSALNRLTSAEFAAAPYAVFITRSDSLIADTDYKSVWYSLSDSGRLEGFTEDALRITALLDTVADKTMIGYSFDGTVGRTVYDDGTVIYVNHGDTDKKIDGITVPAHGFTAGGK